ncbi:MAG: Uma2 family endonuclease [Gammaproteobacteria bacterium]|nr:Uma2 family endonuclease [Gammaproteobacteria bacterium]
MTISVKKNQRYTYTDYLTWSDDTRWELIDGAAYAMLPAPTTRHQTIQLNLAGILLTHFRGKSCRPFLAPIDVKLSDSDLLQPDLLIVCDPKKIEEKAIVGAPDLVIEILSPSTETRDRREKKALYERYRVAEYWLVSVNGFVEQYVLGAIEQYGVPIILSADETLTSATFPDLIVAVSEIFEGVHPTSS